MPDDDMRIDNKRRRRSATAAVVADDASSPRLMVLRLLRVLSILSLRTSLCGAKPDNVWPPLASPPPPQPPLAPAAPARAEEKAPIRAAVAVAGPDCMAEFLAIVNDPSTETACPDPNSCAADCFAVFGTFSSQCYNWARASPDMDQITPMMALCNAPPASTAAAPDCLTLLAGITDPFNDACCADQDFCDADGVPQQCSRSCADLLEPFFEQCSGWIKAQHADPFYASLIPLIPMCEDAEFGRYSTGFMNRRCGRAEKGRFLTTGLAAACCGRSQENCPDGSTMPPLPIQCSPECAPVYEDFYAECHPTFDGTDEEASYTAFLNLCQGL